MADQALVAAVERAALWAWPPRETRYLRGWLLRASGPLSPRRVNSAQTLAFDPGRLEPAIAEAEAWYAARDLPACFQLTEAAVPPGLDAALAERGYARESESLVMLGDPAAAAAGDDGTVEILHRPLQSVLAAMADPLWGDPQRRERAALLARIRRPHRYALVTVGGEPAAGGLVVADGPLAGLFALRTQPPFRRQGLARRLVAACAAWVRTQGAERLYLQVEADNAPAIDLYARLGFAAAYRYGYRKATEC